MEASPWLVRSASHCWITLPRCPIRDSMPRSCIRCQKFCFLAWINDLRDEDPDIIAVDGKTSRRSHDKRKSRNPLHLVSRDILTSY
jgi:hypothetical protein